MTPVGHCLAGMTIAALGVRQGVSSGRVVATYGVLMLAANLPDAPLPGWGHDRYEVSHSLFVTTALILALGLAWVGLRQTRWRDERRFLGLISLAWLSHLMLDTMYSHGHGLGMFWPVSDGSLALPVKCFDTLNMPIFPITRQHLSVFGVELVAYGSVFLVASLGRRAYPWIRAPH